MELKLVLAKGEPKGKVIDIAKSPAVIGREPECDVVIASPKVSRKHCRIEITGNAVSLSDLGSANGTFVNGKKVQKVQLHGGDKLVVGPLGFVVELVGAGAKPSGKAAAPPQDINDFLAGLENDDDLLGGEKKK
jgi:pSer/pThr/pTyr-binding forkhead associated (FHA) protein